MPCGLAPSWECRADQSRQAHPEEAQEPSWGAARGQFDHAFGQRHVIEVTRSASRKCREASSDQWQCSEGTRALSVTPSVVRPRRRSLTTLGQNWDCRLDDAPSKPLKVEARRSPSKLGPLAHRRGCHRWISFHARKLLECTLWSHTVHAIDDRWAVSHGTGLRFAGCLYCLEGP